MQVYREEKLIVAAFVTTLGILSVGSYLTESRAWGISSLGYFTYSARFLVLGSAILLGGLIWFISRKYNSMELGLTARGYAISGLLGGIVFLILIIGLQTTTHFMGDGYQLLSGLPLIDPLLKGYDLGGVGVPYLISKVLPEGDNTSLYAYRITAWSAAVVLFSATVLFARCLNAGRVERLLAVFTFMTGGYALMFFGYVENYALFVVLFAATCMAGIAVADRRLSWLWLFPLSGATIATHVLGLALLPAILFAGATNSDWFRSVLNLARRQLTVSIITLTLLATIVYLIAWKSDFPLVSPLEDEYTLEGYTLLSGSHLLDFLNLVFELVPAVLLCAVCLLLCLPSVRLVRAQTFLIVVAASSLYIGFILEPQLGMPRDWDAFSFVGIPLTLLLVLSAIDSGGKPVSTRFVLGLALVLNCTVLFSRATILHVPETGIAQFMNAANLDKLKNRTAMFTLGDYYRRAGDREQFLEITKLRASRYPQEVMLQHIEKLTNQSRVSETKQWIDQVLQLDPRSWEAWNALAGYLIDQRLFDSALTVTDIALRFNPNNAGIWNQRGIALYYLFDLKKALGCWRECVRLDRDWATYAHNLARGLLEYGDSTGYRANLELAARTKSASKMILLEYADLLIGDRKFADAATTLKRALDQGLDTNTFNARVAKIPPLQMSFDSNLSR